MHFVKLECCISEGLEKNCLPAKWMAPWKHFFFKFDSKVLLLPATKSQLEIFLLFCKMLAGLSTLWKESNNFFHGLRNKPFKKLHYCWHGIFREAKVIIYRSELWTPHVVQNPPKYRQHENYMTYYYCK